MKTRVTIAAFIVFSVSNAMAQTKPAADPKDVASMDAIIHALYDVISGDAGKPRNWDRLRSLFYENARLIPAGKNAQTGVVSARALSPDDYIKRNEAFFATDGFYERESARTVDQFGNIAHVFSTYESRHAAKDEKPFQRGINSIQLLNDGKRWWVLSIYWQAERPDNPIPKRYLKSRK